MRSVFSFFAAVAVLLINLVADCSALGCSVDLNNQDDPCLKFCMTWDGIEDIFVCDLSNPWLHHYSANPEWLAATPPDGTGAHEYAVFQGGQPPCAGLGGCPGCGSTTAKHLCSVYVDPADCSVSCSKTLSESSAGATMTSMAAIGAVAGAALVI